MKNHSISRSVSTFINAVKAKRVEDGVTLNDIAAKSGVPLNYLISFENGSRLPTVPEIDAIAEAMDAHIEFKSFVQMEKAEGGDDESSES